MGRWEGRMGRGNGVGTEDGYCKASTVLDLEPERKASQMRLSGADNRGVRSPKKDINKIIQSNPPPPGSFIHPVVISQPQFWRYFTFRRPNKNTQSLPHSLNSVRFYHARTGFQSQPALNLHTYH
jgi:hypothetical protein